MEVDGLFLVFVRRVHHRGVKLSASCSTQSASWIGPAEPLILTRSLGVAHIRNIFLGSYVFGPNRRACKISRCIPATRYEDQTSCSLKRTNGPKFCCHACHRHPSSVCRKWMVMVDAPIGTSVGSLASRTPKFLRGRPCFNIPYHRFSVILLLHILARCFGVLDSPCNQILMLIL